MLTTINVLSRWIVPAGQVEYLLTGRDPLDFGTIVDAVTNLGARADTLGEEIEDTKAVLGKTLSDKVAAVEENFKETVDATLTPAVKTLTTEQVQLKLRLLKLESACTFEEFQKEAPTGDTLDSFVAAVCGKITQCEEGKEYETKAPTSTVFAFRQNLHFGWLW
jgi:hypothetical protein